MGACASLPKGMRDEASAAAPPPEPRAIEESVADQQTTKEVVKDENKANQADETKLQSLGSLLDKPEKADEAPVEPKKEEAKVEAGKEGAEAKEEAKKEEPKVEEAKAKKEEPKVEEAKAKEEEPKVEEAKAKKEEPKVEEAKTEAPAVSKVTDPSRS